MFRKNFSISLAQENNVLRIYVDTDKKEYYISVAELVLNNINDDYDHYREKIISIADVLGDRSIKKGLHYIMITCIDSYGLSTKIVILHRELDEVLKELEVVCSLIETASQGIIRCIPLNNITSIFKHCFKSFSPINFLIQILTRNKNIEHNIIPHPISVSTSHSFYTTRDYDYFLSLFSRGSIAIGYLYNNPNISIMLSDDHLLRHIAIVGSTGSGKSTTAAVIAEKSVQKGYAIIIIDWHGEYETLLQHFKTSIVYTNPLKGFIPDALNLEELIKHEPLSFIEILESSLELTPPQAHILEDAVNMLTQRFISNGYCIDIIIDIIQNSSASARWFTESREALLRKLKPLSSTYLNIQWNKIEKISIEKGKIYIFDVSYISNTRVRKILSTLLIRSIILRAQYNTIVRPILIIVDEAHNLFHDETPLSTLIAEVRKWNIGFVLITQAPSMLAPVILKNTNTKIIHSLKSSSDIETIISTINLRKEHKKIISALNPGEALLIIPELAEPIVIKVDRI